MSIFNHFQNLTLSNDQKVALEKLEAFLNSRTQVFMLKGYAGSGKTTILKGLADYFKAEKKELILMAPTGRAAKVLRDKTGQGVTIHKGIYNFSKLESVNKNSKDDAEHSFHYYFPINKMESNEKIIIVDESSMISSRESKHELFTFGTNILLNDLMTFSSLQTTNNKIIFVGDPAQLPPVGDNKSFALESEYFEGLGISYDETEMKQVLRQDDNLILENAKCLREILCQPKRTHLTFNYDNSSFIKTEPIDIIERYTSLFPNPEIGDGVIISFSNPQCYHCNNAIRERLFPGQKEVVAGDLVLVNNNNYHTYGTELYNGDIAKVVDADSEIVSHSAPVYCDIEGEKVKVVVKLNFKKITIRIPTHPDEINCYIIDSLLHSVDRDLSIYEMKALYINFVMRFNNDQERRKHHGLKTYKIGSEEFRQALKTDPFFNALKVKFGYAITCHKAQGGEWDKVFVDYQGRVGLNDDPLRWCYTATTRGVNTVYALNAPHFGKLHKFKFTSIGNIGTLPNDSLALENIPVSPFHSDSQHKGKSLKYWEMMEKLETTDYSIVNVETFGFLERYTILKEEVNIIIEANHKGSGHFIEKFHVENQVDEKIKAEIETIFNSDFNPVISINYTPEFDFLGDLHSMMQDSCSDLGITITSIRPGKFYVNYFLKTNSVCSYIQFYYNDNNQLTTAMPKAYNCNNDIKLQLLIQKLLQYAS